MFLKKNIHIQSFFAIIRECKLFFLWRIGKRFKLISYFGRKPFYFNFRNVKRSSIKKTVQYELNCDRSGFILIRKRDYDCTIISTKGLLKKSCLTTCFWEGFSIEEETFIKARSSNVSYLGHINFSRQDTEKKFILSLPR